ncbi:MAG: hydantoinase/oxoprolinase family protein [Desulfovibrio sp.]|jgi:N-methylhydantoinase A/oxoprolinase/acetone carboxylase beta subunit|nr:hydantoinase/oxoprolinase family protein [Desulfovibrio sp.]
MREKILLGIDAGGTHTDAALLACREEKVRLLASVKTITRHDDLAISVREVLAGLAKISGIADKLAAVDAVTLGTTLAVNALAQGRADTVGLVLSAGPGLDPRRFALGEHLCVMPGGLDHRGVEVTAPQPDVVAREASRWRDDKVTTVAVVGKFSPRNPAHEKIMEKAVAGVCALSVTAGHNLSGALNFPRRIATAYYNAAVERLHHNFLDATGQALAAAGIRALPRLLKSDGGAAPAALSRREPVQSILSGPAASAMGAMALCPGIDQGCSLLLDVGGTTTDMALFVDGSPVVDRDGMVINGRRTLVRALASVSIGVGGDSLITAHERRVRVGPLREGPAMAFGGARPTLLDALNVLDAAQKQYGNAAASRRGVEALAAGVGIAPDILAGQAVDEALSQITRAARALIAGINSRPVYTLAALRAVRAAEPARIWLVGGPADCLRERLAAAFALPVDIPQHAAVANAVGAALTLPTASLEIYADTGKRLLRAPTLDIEEAIPPNYTLEMAGRRANELLARMLAAHPAGDGEPDEPGESGGAVEVLEADMFAVLDDYGRGSRDMRVTSRAAPGIAGRL